MKTKTKTNATVGFNTKVLPKFLYAFEVSLKLVTSNRIALNMTLKDFLLSELEIADALGHEGAEELLENLMKISHNYEAMKLAEAEVLHVALGKKKTPNYWDKRRKLFGYYYVILMDMSSLLKFRIIPAITYYAGATYGSLTLTGRIDDRDDCAHSSILTLGTAVRQVLSYDVRGYVSMIVRPSEEVTAEDL